MVDQRTASKTGRSRKRADLSRSDATTHLATGAYVDRDFRRAAINQVYFQPARAVAPSHGFDATLVLFHCWQAWRWEFARDAVVLLSLFTTFLLSGTVGAAVLGIALVIYVIGDFGTLVRRALLLIKYGRESDVTVGELFARALRLSALWVVVVVVGAALGLSNLESLITYLFDLAVGGSSGPGGADGVEPRTWLAVLVALLIPIATVGYRSAAQRAIDGLATHDQDWRAHLTERMRTIGRQQYPAVVRYAGFEPFVGAGWVLRDWSFALRLMPAVQPGERPWTGEEVEQHPAPFDAVDLIEHLRRRFDELRATERHPTQRLDTAVAGEQMFLPAATALRSPVRCPHAPNGTRSSATRTDPPATNSSPRPAGGAAKSSRRRTCWSRFRPGCSTSSSRRCCCRRRRPTSTRFTRSVAWGNPREAEPAGAGSGRCRASS